MINNKKNISKSFYFASSILFIMWMIFFDSNDVYSQFQLKQKRFELEREKQYYLNKIKEVKSDRKALSTDMELLEMFAREKYYMKRKGEEVFVVVETNE